MGQRAVHAKGGIRMIIVSQNKERVLWFGRAFNALEYNEDISKKGKQEIIRHKSVFRMAVLKKSQSMTARKGVWRS